MDVLLHPQERKKKRSVRGTQGEKNLAVSPNAIRNPSSAIKKGRLKSGRYSHPASAISRKLYSMETRSNRCESQLITKRGNGTSTKWLRPSLSGIATASKGHYERKDNDVKRANRAKTMPNKWATVNPRRELKKQIPRFRGLYRPGQQPYEQI